MVIIILSAYYTTFHIVSIRDSDEYQDDEKERKKWKNNTIVFSII